MGGAEVLGGGVTRVREGLGGGEVLVSGPGVAKGEKVGGQNDIACTFWKSD